MNITRKGFTALILSLLLLLVCLPAAVFSEEVNETTQEIFVTNTPIKGKIILEKTGMVLTGFVESQDSTGFTVYAPDYHEGYLEGAVYEIRAVEDIVGKEGTKWFKADEVAATITTTAEGKDESPLLPLGHYYIVEKSAPAGYKVDENRYDVLLQAADQKTPVVIETVSVTDEFLPAKINFSKAKQVIVTKEHDNGLVSSEIETAPGEGFVFGLYNHEEIKYAGGSLPKGTLVGVAVTDKDGKASFAGNFPHGHYTLKEIAAPDGWKINEAAYHIDIDRKQLTDEGICEFTLEAPIIDEIVHGTPRIAKLDIAGSDYLPNTLIEVRNEEGEVVCKAYTGEDGFVPAFPALPGKYTYKEVLAPEGYELCVTEFSFTVDSEGKVDGRTHVTDDYTRFYIMKVDEASKPLAGVQFGLYATDTNYLVKTAVTDEKGFATFEKVPYGDYYIQEKEPLPGYVRDYTRVPVTVDGTFINPKEPLAIINNIPTEILMQKVDQDGKALADAEFGLFNEEGKLVMTAVSDKDGIISFTHVEQGRYTVRETKAPDGYLLSTKENIHTVTTIGRENVKINGVISKNTLLEYTIPDELLLNDPHFAMLMMEADKYIGYPFVYGASNPAEGFDCSGFVSWIFIQSGVYNTGRRGATGLHTLCTEVEPEDIRPGDLVFFEGTMGPNIKGITHVGIYVGNNMMLHAGDPIGFADLTDPNWVKHLVDYGRLPYEEESENE